MRQRTGRRRVVIEKWVGLVVGQTGARLPGRLDGECGGVSEPPCRLAAPRTPHRPQPLGSLRWLEDAAPSGDAGAWIRGSDPTLSGPQAHNILEQLPEGLRPWLRAVVARATSRSRSSPRPSPCRICAPTRDRYPTTAGASVKASTRACI
jgi:hypothetical protein